MVVHLEVHQKHQMEHEVYKFSLLSILIPAITCGKLLYGMTL